MSIALNRPGAGLLSRLAALAFFCLAPSFASAQACPDVGLTGAPITQDANSLSGSMAFPVVAGGSIDLGACPDLPGVGWVAESPDFELTLSGNAGGMDLQFAVTAACDTTLLVNDSFGEWHYVDDEDGVSNPRLVLSAAADGLYDIWIGTYDSATCDATLTLQTLPAGTGGGGGGAICPDYNIDATVLTYDIGQLASPQVMDIIAGGDVDLFNCPETGGSGYVIQGPDFQMDLSGNTAGLDVRVSVDAVCDTILLINDATAAWQYVDDANGTLNPEIILPAAMDGSYDIWVGTLGAETCDATLTIAAVGAATAPATGGKGPAAPATTEAPPATTAAADPGNLTAFRANIGETYSFTVTGSVDGVVWGDGIYTDDSDLSTAAVHAGVLAAGQTGVVTVQMTGPQASFGAANVNGVGSRSFGSWGGSYTFVQ